MSTDKTTPEQTEQPAAAEVPAALAPETTAAPAAEAPVTEAPAAATSGVVAFLRDHWLTALLAVLLVGAIVYGAVFTASSSRWEASSGDFEAQLAETTAAKAEVQAAKAEVEAAKAEVEGRNTELQGDLDECRSTVEAADGVLAVNDEAEQKLTAFNDTFGKVMAAETEADFDANYTLMETQGNELDEIATRFEAAEKTYTERSGLCKD